MSNGNSFTFYYPKTSGTSGSGKKLAMKKTSIGGKEPRYVKPFEFIEKNFSAVSSAPFGSGALLKSHRVIRKLDLIRATLEGGYGRRHMWTVELAMHPNQATELTKYLFKRMEMVITCLELDHNEAYKTVLFYEHVESSEKTTLAFILGGIGTFLAAQNWLGAGGSRMNKFMHAGLYAKGADGATPLIKFSSASGKCPDYLVEAENGDWHVFESKGGRTNNRWLRIIEGLSQIADVTSISWAGKVPQKAITCVCVHTSVDPGRTLSVTAVDPPGDQFSADETAPLRLIESVCNLLLCLEAIEYFRAFTAMSTLENLEVAGEEWTYGKSDAFGGVRVAIPRKYLIKEKAIRLRIATFFAVGDVASENRYQSGNEYSFSLFASRVRKKLASHLGGLDSLPNSDDDNQDLQVVTQRLKSVWLHYGEHDFLSRSAEILGLDDLSDEMTLGEVEKVVVKLTENEPYAITSGGLVVQSMFETKTDIGID
jgi:hypothetical protein